ncbi:DUF5028 domain-containing protein [Amphibacillus cookii]|uniref:DUF5028 domain-containing protein n=1 Tax=Amphibacillus cookii TaxID=767787 RepID=UPI001957C128|nr:DUF5028 domain-containing protein [Amphibacillus cookii]MBM7542283.1 hypothetical protein [Amphibacillus cookii]
MKKILLVLLYAILLIGLSIRIWYINKDVTVPPVSLFEIGEEVAIEKDIFLDEFENMDGYTVTVNSAEIIPYETFLAKYDYQEDEENPLFEESDMTFPEMVYDLHLTIKNTNTIDNPEKHSGINFINYQLMGTDFSLQISDPLYMIANPDLEGKVADGFRLRPETEMDFHLPFYFAPSSIVERVEVEDIKEDNVYLTVSLYPTAKQILIE